MVRNWHAGKDEKNTYLKEKGALEWMLGTIKNIIAKRNGHNKDIGLKG